MFRQGIARVLSGYGGMEIVGQADNDDGAVELARRTRPDVVLMQVQMPISRAKENLRRMREATDPPPKVVIVTMIEDPRHVRELMDLGASAYIVKSASAEHLVAAVRAAILDPKSKHAVVGMPLGMLEEAQEAHRACSRPGARDTAPGRPGSVQPPDRGGTVRDGGHRQAPPRQHLRKDGGQLPRPGHQEGALRGVDHHPGRHRRPGWALMAYKDL